MPNYQPPKGHAFDREAARALLAEAGYPDGFDTDIYYRDVFRVYLPEPSLVAVEIQDQLRENAVQVFTADSHPVKQQRDEARVS